MKETMSVSQVAAQHSLKELRRQASELGLSSSGTKQQLANRISHGSQVFVSGGSIPIKTDYTTAELEKIAEIMYETIAQARVNVYDARGQAIYVHWENLSDSEKNRAASELEKRIKREGLLGYLERKRPAVGDMVTNSIISELKSRKLL